MRDSGSLPNGWLVLAVKGTFMNMKMAATPSQRCHYISFLIYTKSQVGNIFLQVSKLFKMFASICCSISLWLRK